MQKVVGESAVETARGIGSESELRGAERGTAIGFGTTTDYFVDFLTIPGG